MLTFNRFFFKTDCIVEESSNVQMETHLSHLEDLCIEKGKQGLGEFISVVKNLLAKFKGQESDLQINAKIDGAPALLFGRDPREKFKNQFFISLKHVYDPQKNIIREGSKLIHSEKDINSFFGSRPSFAKKLIILFNELNRAYDNSGLIYQCDVLFAGKEDTYIRTIDGEDYVVFKPNVITYAIPVDYTSPLYQKLEKSEIGVVVHDSFSAKAQENNITLKQKSRNVDSIVKSGERANVFILKSNFKQARVEVDDSKLLKINSLISECELLLSSITDGFNNQYVGSQAMEYLKIFINKQLDLPNSGIFKKELDDKGLNKFLKGFQTFLKNRFDVEIKKRKTDKGRSSQQKKLNDLLNFLNIFRESLLSLLKMFTKMIKIKKEILSLLAEVKGELVGTFFEKPDGTLIPTKGEGHVLFNGPTQVKIVDRLEFTTINRKLGGKR